MAWPWAGRPEAPGRRRAPPGAQPYDPNAVQALVIHTSQRARLAGCSTLVCRT
ncbi:hypothetical protein [Streptomyces scabiei]|uniref:hypothetical protein n=1 Tax=Streptomyces scabiei TaxID=1930 RepID=UPI002FF29A67